MKTKKISYEDFVSKPTHDFSEISKLDSELLSLGSISKMRVRVENLLNEDIEVDPLYLGYLSELKSNLMLLETNVRESDFTLLNLIKSSNSFHRLVGNEELLVGDYFVGTKEEYEDILNINYSNLVINVDKALESGFLVHIGSNFLLNTEEDKIRELSYVDFKNKLIVSLSRTFMYETTVRV